jgi:hypothetical protein
MDRILLRKSVVVRAFNNVERQVAIALDISAQAVNAWGRYLPELAAHRVLELRPDLRPHVQRAKPKRRRRPTVKTN